MHENFLKVESYSAGDSQICGPGRSLGASGFRAFCKNPGFSTGFLGALPLGGTWVMEKPPRYELGIIFSKNPPFCISYEWGGRLEPTPGCFCHVQGWEKGGLEKLELAERPPKRLLYLYTHDGFWYCWMRDLLR